MKFGTATINETQHQFIKFYKEQVEKASGGRIEVQIYPASQLGPIPREIQGVQLGSIQGYIGPVDFFVGVDPRFGVFSAPMLFRDDAERCGDDPDPAIERRCSTWRRPSAWSASPPEPRRVGLRRQASRSCGSPISQAKSCASTAPSSNARRWRSSALPASACRCPRWCRRSTRAPSTARSADFRCSSTMKMNDLIKTITVTNDTYINSIAVVSEAVARHAAAGLAEDRDRTAASRWRPRRRAWEVDFTKKLVGDWNALGGTVHTLPADDLAKMKTLLDPVADAVDQGSAGGARHAAKGARCRHEILKARLPSP